MGTAMMGRGGSAGARKQAESGFSLLEVMISMVILTVGLVSLLGVFGLAMATTQASQEGMIAKQLANEAYESIVTARNSSQLTWDQINNGGSCSGVNPTTGGIFLSGKTPIYNSGADGIIGTCDDTVAGEQTLREPGPGGNYGDSDDVLMPLTAYQRTITISPVLDADSNPIASIRNVTITVQYTTPQTLMQKTYTLNSYISQYQ